MPYRGRCWYSSISRSDGLAGESGNALVLLFMILLFPRVALVLMWIFSTYLERAFHGGLLLPVLGVFLPLTTIVHAWELNSGMPTARINLLWLLIAGSSDID